MGSQSTGLRVDHKLGIQSLKQTLIGAVYTVVHDKENTFFLILKKSLDNSADLTVKGIGIQNSNINVPYECPWEAIKWNWADASLRIGNAQGQVTKSQTVQDP